MAIAKDWKNMLLVEYAKDKFACDVLDGIKGDDEYRIVNGMIYYKGIVYCSIFKPKVQNFARST